MSNPYDPNYYPRQRANHPNDDFNPFDPDVLSALREAYTFITQPQRMESGPTSRDPTVLTYNLHDYNSLTEMLRRAIKKGEALEKKVNNQ